MKSSNLGVIHQDLAHLSGDVERLRSQISRVVVAASILGVMAAVNCALTLLYVAPLRYGLPFR